MSLKRPLDSTHKIDSPMAKLTTKGEVMCTLCGKIIKPASQKLWNAHVVSVKHKEMLDMLRQSVNSKKTEKATTNVHQTVKDENKVAETVASVHPSLALAPPTKGILKNKRRPSEQPVVFLPPLETSKDAVGKNISGSTVSPTPPKQLKLTADSKMTTGGNSSSSGGQSNSEQKSISQVVSDVTVAMEEGDGGGGGDAEDIVRKEKQEELVDASSDLPAGFFDDPKLDAKARNVEYVDPMEKELQEFQKVIQQEELASEMMQVEETTITLHEREIEQIEGQMSYFARAANLFEQKRSHELPQNSQNDSQQSGVQKQSISKEPKMDTSSMETRDVIAHFLKLETDSKEEKEKTDQTMSLQDNILVKLNGAMRDNLGSYDNIYARNFVKSEPENASDSGSEAGDDDDNFDEFSEFDMSNWRKKSILK